MLEDKRLKIFAAVVATRRFTAAASSLGGATSTQFAVDTVADVAGATTVAPDAGVVADATTSTHLDVEAAGAITRTDAVAIFVATPCIYLEHDATTVATDAGVVAGATTVAPARKGIAIAPDAKIWPCAGDVHIKITHN